jgi:purine-binding chemotaxis protein CheW
MTMLEQVLTHRRESKVDIVNVDEPLTKLVIFALGNDWFAFNGVRIQEILLQTGMFFVPGCPPSLEGVINVRGDIKSVIRLNEILHLPLTSEAHPATPTILLGQTNSMSSGIRVDRVVDVIDIPQSSIFSPPATLPEHMRILVLGVFRYQAQSVAILDLERIFADYMRGLG